jgi:hypothetical protein
VTIAVFFLTNDKIFETVVALQSLRKVPLIRIRVREQELTDGCALNRFPTGATLVHHAESLKKAQEIVKAYKRAAGNRGAGYD